MSDRILRINEAVRATLGRALGSLSDPRLGFVTITGVKIARDMRAGQVFYSVLGDEAQRADTQAALDSSRALLQREMAREVKMHHTPQLTFVYDDTTDTALRIASLLDDVRAEDEPR